MDAIKEAKVRARIWALRERGCDFFQVSQWIMSDFHLGRVAAEDLMVSLGFHESEF